MSLRQATGSISLARTVPSKRAKSRRSLLHAPASSQPSSQAPSHATTSPTGDAPATPRSLVWVLAAVTASGLVAVALPRGRDTAAGRLRGVQREEPTVAVGAALPDGPAWPGELDIRGIQLEIPAGYIQPRECETTPEPWHFPGMTREQVLALAREARLPLEASTALQAGLQCNDQGCSYTAPWELLGNLPTESRSTLYRALRRLPGNKLQLFAYLRPRALAPWSEMPGLSPRVRSLLARATWTLDDHHAFSDQPWLCAQLDTDAERVEALRVLRTRYGLDVSVRVPTRGDIAPLVRYWSVGNDPAAVRAALAGARGRLLPVAALLPPMARVRLNRFPAMTALDYDCFWTAARFFEGATPSDHFPGPQGILDLVRTEYVQVSSSDARLGDLVAFVAPDGTFVHTASQVAGDVLFTKNGRSHQRPWVLMHLEEVRAMYPHVREVRWYRRRTLP